MNNIKNFILVVTIVPILFFTEFNYTQPIYVNSIMKCGTHLLIKCLELLTNRKGTNTYGDKVTIDKLPQVDGNSILFYHVPFSDKAVEVLQRNNFKGIFIYRDPRDRVVSLAFFILLYKRELLEKYGLKNNENLVHFPQLLTRLIKEVKTDYNSYLPWMNSPLFHSLKFEDLVGPKAGGKHVRQYEAIKKICDYLEIKKPHPLIESCIKKLYGQTWSFREGKIGSWKKYFTQEQIELFKKEAGDLLIELGYEKDQNWGKQKDHSSQPATKGTTNKTESKNHPDEFESRSF